MAVRDPGTVHIGSNALARKRSLAMAASAVVIGLVAPVVRADTLYSEWNGSSNTTWSNAGNWNATTGVPSSTVGALFDTPFSNQPNLTAAASTNGIWMATGVDQNVTINASAAYQLTLGGTAAPTMDGITTDLLMNDTGGDTLTFGPNVTVKFGHNSGVLNVNNNDTLVIAGSIYTTNGNPTTFTGDGTGTIDFTGNLDSGGGGGLTVNNITLIMDQNNTSAAGISVGANTLVRLNAAGAIPAGESLGFNAAGTLQMRTDTSTTFTGNYSFNSTTLNLGQLTSAGSNNTVTLNGTVGFGNNTTFNLTTGDGDNLAIIGTVHVGNGYQSNSTLNPTGTTMSISGNVNAVSASTTTVSQGLILSGNTSGNSISGSLGDGAVDSKGTMPLSIQKTGTSTWTLSGQNTYSGNTSVSAGTLLIDGNSSGATGAVSVTGGTLGGNGTIGGITTVSSAGTLAPGDGTGTLTFSQNLTMSSLATATFGGNDLANVVGTLNLTGGWKLILNSGFQDGGSVVLFTFGTPGTLNLNPTINDANLGFTPSGSLSVTEVGNSIVLNGISDVPEPATLGLLAVGGITLLTRRRRREKCKVPTVASVS